MELYEMLKVAFGDTLTTSLRMIFGTGREDRNSDKCVDNQKSKKLWVREWIWGAAVISAGLVAEHQDIPRK
jgi:hypothetical protein